MNSNQLGRVIGPTFMYNWLRPVSTGQAPTRSRPACVRAVGSAGSMSAGPRPPTCILYTEYSLHSCTHSSYYYIHVYIQVVLHALHSFTRGPAHRCHMYTQVLASQCGVKALHSSSPSACGVKTLHSPSNCCVNTVKALHSLSTCCVRPYVHTHYTI